MHEPTGQAWQSAKAERNWLVYRPIPRKDHKPRKLPVHEGRIADRAIAARMTFDEAVQAAQAAGSGHGIGYLPRPGSAMVVLDLDGVLDAELDWREEVLPAPGMYLTGESYTEISPSGTGLHVLLPREGWPEATIDNGVEAIGLHASGSLFIAITLDALQEPHSRAVAPAPRLQGHVLPALLERLAARASDAEREPGAGGEHGWFDGLPPEARVAMASVVLEALPAEWIADREQWLRVTFALRGYPELHDVWDAWSQYGGSKYDAEGNDAVWYGRERGENTIGIGSFIRWAGDYDVDLGPWRVQSGTSRMQSSIARVVARMTPEVVEGLQARDQVEGEERAAAEDTGDGRVLLVPYTAHPDQVVGVARQVEEHLGKHRRVFALGRLPHYVRTGAEAEMDPDTLKSMVVMGHMFAPVKGRPTWEALRYGLVRFLDARGRNRDMPTAVAAVLDALAGELLPPVIGILQAPALLPDGRMLCGQEAPYYDEELRLWVAVPPLRGAVVPFSTPAQALAWLRGEWLGEFAFESEADFGRALTMLGSLLTAKTMLGDDDGPPAYLFTAPQAQTGKTVLARVIVAAATGREATAPTPPDEEEMRKVIFAKGLKQEAAVIFDNQARGKGVRSEVICDYTTTVLQSSRVLGESREVTVGARMVIAYTGNAIAAAGDMLPRTIVIRLHWHGEGGPALRRYARMDVVKWTKAHRATIIEAMRVILTGAVGEPEIYGRFKTWSKVVLWPIAQAMRTTCEDLVPDWVNVSAEDEVIEDFAPLGEAMMKAMMQHGELLAVHGNHLKEGVSAGTPAFTLANIRDLCGQALARIAGTSEHEVREYRARKVASIVQPFEGLAYRGYRMRRVMLNLGERTERKLAVCFVLVPADEGPGAADAA